MIYRLLTRLSRWAARPSSREALTVTRYDPTTRTTTTYRLEPR